MYDVGTTIDLSYLNKKPEVENTAPKLRERFENLVDVGTQYSFKKAFDNQIITARRIPIVFAS